MDVSTDELLIISTMTIMIYVHDCNEICRLRKVLCVCEESMGSCPPDSRLILCFMYHLLIANNIIYLIFTLQRIRLISFDYYILLDINGDK